MSRSLRTQPAVLLGISNQLVAFYFNRAIWTFGSTLDAELEEISNKAKKPGSAQAKKSMRLALWLDEGQGGLYRDPAASV